MPKKILQIIRDPNIKTIQKKMKFYVKGVSYFLQVLDFHSG